MTRRNRKKMNKNSKNKKINPIDDKAKIISDREKRIMEYVFAVIFFLSIIFALVYTIKLISILL